MVVVVIKVYVEVQFGDFWSINHKLELLLFVLIIVNINLNNKNICYLDFFIILFHGLKH